MAGVRLHAIAHVLSALQQQLPHAKISPSTLKHLFVLRALDELRAGLKRSVDEVAGPDSGEIRQKIGLGKRNCVVEELAAGGGDWW